MQGMYGACDWPSGRDQRGERNHGLMDRLVSGRDAGGEIGGVHLQRHLQGHNDPYGRNASQKLGR